MTSCRPGLLAVRAINDYRRRDIFGYFGLRYYLESAAVRSDVWARTVSLDLVATRSQPVFFCTEHFKDHSKDVGIEHRKVFIPGPNECLAEAALLAECGEKSSVFGNPDCVYSYELSQLPFRGGSFLPYINGLRDRQAAIATACDAIPSGIVRYTDIKQFYPSISIEIARKAWSNFCEKASLSAKFRNVGDNLIDGYGKTDLQPNGAILTGPMFSHLLANLVFRDFDQEFSNELPARYFRYVDDIALVGSRDQVARSIEMMKAKVLQADLQFHDDGSPKNLEIPCKRWLMSRHDFSEKVECVSWVRLIASLKQFLLQYPESRHRLENALTKEGFRIPVRDYSKIVREQGFASRILELVLFKWFRRKATNASIPGIVSIGKKLLQRFERRFRKLFDGIDAISGYERKQRLSKIRYCAGRLIYLAPIEMLAAFSEMALGVPELFLHAHVMRAVATRNIDVVLAMGTNVAQATAQPFRADRVSAVLKTKIIQEAKEQSLAVLLMNGVEVCREESFMGSELIRFAATGSDLGMMKSSSRFLRELSCLHGISNAARHVDLLETVFDEDEELTMDAVTQLQQSNT